MVTDINDYDVPQNALSPELHREIIASEQLDAIFNNIKHQYKDLNDLGINYLREFKDLITDEQKSELFTEMLDYIDKNVINIVDIESTYDDMQRQLVIGEYIYEFVCVDLLNSLIPALMESLNITNPEDFDLIINNKYQSNPNIIKSDIAKTINLTLEQLNKLQMLSDVVKTDERYNKLLGKYLFYKDLIEFCDAEKFLEKYLRPLIYKYNSEILWRLI